MRLYLINPDNPMVSITKFKCNHWNQYRVWKPLSLMVLAGLTPPEWDITIIDENLRDVDYATMPRPDLVGITAFTSQASRGYAVADEFRACGIPVVMGGIHATFCVEEALEHVDSVVTGEAETVWTQVLEDLQQDTLKQTYGGELVDLVKTPPARHDLVQNGYRLGSIQTARGCPLNCSFCTVTAFNGGEFRFRPIDDVVEEFKMIREKYVLVVDDNLCGTRTNHITRTKDLFRAMIKAKICKKWICQVTINMADDDELLELAAKAGCMGAFIGFEATTPEGLAEVHKKFNIQNNRDFTESVRRIQRHGILVVGSFIMGLDVDRKGIGKHIAITAESYGVDILNLLILTPLPGTQLWKRMEEEGRIKANNFPHDWQYYTLTFPVAEYRHLSWDDLVAENDECARSFYSLPRILRRAFGSLWHTRKPVNLVANLVSNFSYRNNELINRQQRKEVDFCQGSAMQDRTPVRI